MENIKKSPSAFKIVITVIIIIISVIFVYSLYNFLYSSTSVNANRIITNQIPANVAQTNLPVTGLYEGGDYAISMWVYINSYNINRNKRKHIFEIGGSNFSTVLVAFGAFKNTLIVRTHSRDNETAIIGTSTPGASASIMDTRMLGSTGPSMFGQSTESVLNVTGPTGQNNIWNDTKSIFQDNQGPTGANEENIYSSSSTGSKSEQTELLQNATPASDDATRHDGSLTSNDLNSLFKPLAMDDSIINPTQICDIPSIDMQRWVNISVILSGRTIDVYIDGKLLRSCVTRSYYKVDPTGVSLKIADKGGFDGYINGVATYNTPLSPADIYHIYQAGPSGNSASVGSLVSSLFTGK